MKPRTVQKAARQPRRAGLHLARGPNAGGWLAHAGGSAWYRDRAALLSVLTSSSKARPASQIWLSPMSQADWRIFVLPLLAAGWLIGVSVRRSLVTSLRVYTPGQSTDPDDQSEDEGLFWSGRSAAGLLLPVRGLSPREQAEYTFENVERLAGVLAARFPSVPLGPSLAGTGIDIWRSHLGGPIQTDPQLEVTLRVAGAGGGARIESFVAPGTVTSTAEREGPNGEMFQIPDASPMDLDLTSAYPTALEQIPIGAECIGEGGDPLAPCSISTCVVDVPETAYPPLRYEAADGLVAFPSGKFIGTWTSSELDIATRLGTKILDVSTTWRFEERPEFRAFGAAMRTWRAELPGDSEGRRLAKAIAVQTVGAWGSRPRLTHLSTEPAFEQMLRHVRVKGHGLFEVPIALRQNRRALLPAFAFVVGAVRAWSAALLAGAERAGVRPLYWHTDGGAFATDAGPAIEAARGLGMPLPEAWERETLQRITIWAPGQRHEVYRDGTTRTAAAGISRALEEPEVLQRMKTAEAQASIGQRRAAQRAKGRAPRVYEIDPDMAAICEQFGR